MALSPVFSFEDSAQLPLVKLGIVWSLSFLASFLSFLIVVTLDLFYVPRPQTKDD